MMKKLICMLVFLLCLALCACDTVIPEPSDPLPSTDVLPPTDSLPPTESLPAADSMGRATSA